MNLKRAVLLVAAVILCVASSLSTAKGSGSRESASSSGGSHTVRGHVTKSGTYVAPHRATNPDSSKANNWSTKGNTNPYTGKKGTK